MPEVCGLSFEGTSRNAGRVVAGALTGEDMDVSEADVVAAEDAEDVGLELYGGGRLKRALLELKVLLDEYRHCRPIMDVRGEACLSLKEAAARLLLRGSVDIIVTLYA